MRQLIFIAIGGAAGSVSRYMLAQKIQQRMAGIYPVGTFLINVSGSFMIGFLFSLFERFTVPPEWRLFLTVGFLGGYTTFSTYSLETVNLLRDGETTSALMNILLSNAGGVAAALAGLYAARLLLKIAITA